MLLLAMRPETDDWDWCNADSVDVNLCNEEEEKEEENEDEEDEEEEEEDTMNTPAKFVSARPQRSSALSSHTAKEICAEMFVLVVVYVCL